MPMVVQNAAAIACKQLSLSRRDILSKYFIVRVEVCLFSLIISFHSDQKAISKTRESLVGNNEHPVSERLVFYSTSLHSPQMF